MNNKNTRRYWVNTQGTARVLMSFTRGDKKEPSDIVTAIYGIKECTAFVYYLFKYTKINLMAKDKLQWLRS